LLPPRHPSTVSDDRPPMAVPLEPATMHAPQRTRFELVRSSSRSGGLAGALDWRPLADALARLEQAGVMPIQPDGGPAGNGAVRVDGGVLVSRSARAPGRPGADDFVLVTDFDAETWTATFESASDDHVPTSDTPLYWAGLVEAPSRFGWSETPSAALHGHALETEEEALRLSLPISTRVTEHSTPEDRETLLELLEAHAYPQSRLLVRRGHGFFALGTSADDACQTVLAALSRP